MGYTYRIPTYTDLYYSDPTTLGNSNLDPEQALAEEIGIKFHAKRVTATLAFFNRDSNNLIDYVKENADDLFKASNIAKMNTKGFEASAYYNFKMGRFNQNINASYTYLEDDIHDVQAPFSRYAINSLKHHFTSRLSTSFFKNLSQNIVYKYAERATGESYIVVDFSLILIIKDFQLSVLANNIFNTAYTETNLVPMPKANLLFGLNYGIMYWTLTFP